VFGRLCPLHLRQRPLLRPFTSSRTGAGLRNDCGRRLSSREVPESGPAAAAPAAGNCVWLGTSGPALTRALLLPRFGIWPPGSQVLA